LPKTAKKRHAFGNSVPEFFIDAPARHDKILPLVKGICFAEIKNKKIWL